MKLKLLVLAFLCSILSWGQTTLAAWTYPTTTGNAPATLTAECGIFSATSNFYADGTNGSSNWSAVATRQYFAGVAPTAALCGVTTATGAYSLVAPASPFNNGFSVVFKLPTTGYQDLILTYATRGTASGYTTHDWSYSTDGVTFTPHATIGGRNATTFSNQTVDFSAISALDNLANVYIKLTVTGATALSGNNRFDNVNFTGIILGGTPTVSVTPATLTGFTYLVGSGPSANQTFTVSGANLTANLVLTAPTNYEIATAAGGLFSGSISLTPTAGTVASTTIYVRLKAGLSVGTYNSETIVASSTGATSQNVTCSGTVTGSSLSDIIAVAASESATIASTINDAAPLTSSTGAQVWQFKVRDGGATLADGDNLPTILTAFTLAQAAGNQVSTWSDAINTIALFDGTTFIASGTVTATQIQFTGLNVNVADNTEKTLTLRLSLKCPLGADAFDNEDFGFSLSNANTTFSASGSGKTAFAAQTSANGSNVINVVATKLTFTTQPVTTGINNTMANVVIAATDACGNTDLDFTGSISVTSTGTMTGSPVTVSATSGVSNFSTIIHTVLGTGFTLNATSVGLTSVTSTLFDITAVTAFSPGDFAVIALNSNITCYPAGPNGVYTAGDDEISFITFKDIQNGDTFSITDNGYERVTAGLWGDQEGVYTLTRTGGTIPSGTVITIRLRNVAPLAEFVSPDTAWSVARAAGFPTGSLVMNSGGDQIFFMQGGSWSNPAGTADAVYTPGVYLYAFNTNTGWNSFMNSTQQSGLPIELRCFSLMPGSATDFLEYTGITTPAAKLDWIARLNNPSNWTNRASCAGYTSMHVGQAYSVITGGTYVNGVWTGAKDTNWFDCANWQTLEVPNQTVNVDINSTYAQRDAVIDIVANASTAALYGNIATSNNISITDKVLQIEGNANNRLDVHGNLLLDGTGTIDMDDSNAATADGQINLYGNWTNNLGSAAFSEGNGTVHFTGTTPQIINNVTPLGTEVFYNVVLNNNFTTAVSNDLIASGNLTINPTKTLVISSNDYVQVTNNITNNGIFNVLNNGSLIQINDAGVNTGSINYERIPSVKLQDYVYWSSPVSSFDVNSISPLTPAYYHWSWNPTMANLNGGQGYWENASTNMLAGKGYIVRAPNGFSNSVNQNWNVQFTGVPFNGVYNTTIARGSDLGAGSAGPNGVMRLATDDNWNLLGNPYPSAISINAFLTANTNIDGFVRLWTHGTLPSTATVDPFYDNFVSNYTAADYIAVNGAGATSGPGTLSVVGGGQGFFVLMNPGAAGSDTVTFNNAMRNKTYSNSQFYRTTSNQAQLPSGPNYERNGIWLDLVNNDTQATTRTLVAYVSEATYGKDRMYDALTDYKQGQNIYSLIGNDVFAIQGRPVPFDENDKVPMGVKIPTSGKYKIAIGAVDGLFLPSNGNQKIYLEDTFTNVIHDLTITPYEFDAQAGVDNARFVLRYTTNALGNETFVSNDDLVIYSSNQLSVHSSQKINQVKVFDVLGRELFNSNKINANELVLPVAKNSVALLLEIELENGDIIKRKTIF